MLFELAPLILGISGATPPPDRDRFFMFSQLCLWTGLDYSCFHNCAYRRGSIPHVFPIMLMDLAGHVTRYRGHVARNSHEFKINMVCVLGLRGPTFYSHGLGKARYKLSGP